MQTQIPNQTENEDTTQSFVLRVWQDQPVEWRGSIRHVQSDAHKGFTSLEQAMRFVERQTRQFGRIPMGETAPAENKFNWSLASRNRRMLLLAGGIALMAILAILLLSQYAIGPIVGFAH